METIVPGYCEVALHFQRWLPDKSAIASILLVHGFGEHVGRYAHVVEHLGARGYAVYGFDLRGHGRSPGPRGHIHSWTEFRMDLAAVVLAVQREQPGPLFLYGHSMGGLIVLEYGLHYPAGLGGVIASAPLLAQPGVSRSKVMAARLVSRVLPRFSMEVKLDTAGLSRDPEVVQAYVDDLYVHSRGSARLSTEIEAAVLRTQSMAPLWNVPLLMLYGTEDTVVPSYGAQDFYARVPISDKRLIEYPGAHHEPHNDLDRRQVLDDVADWVLAHTPAATT